MKAMASRGESSQSPRMFESDLIDYFSRCPFWIVPILYVPATLAMIAASRQQAGMGWLATGGLFIGGFAFWTLAEYWLHRTVFHFEGESAFAKRVHFLIHGVHHKWPHEAIGFAAAWHLNRYRKNAGYATLQVHCVLRKGVKVRGLL